MLFDVADGCGVDLKSTLGADTTPETGQNICLSLMDKGWLEQPGYNLTAHYHSLRIRTDYEVQHRILEGFWHGGSHMHIIIQEAD